MGLTRKYLNRALKLLRKALPELRMGYDLLFVPPVDHILRCFVFETTVGFKDTAFFWRAVTPLYRPYGSPVMNYGERLFGGARVSLLESELERTIDRLVQTVRGGELARLNQIQTPRDFLQQINWAALPSTPNYQIDLALTHYMAGDARSCQEILDRLVGGSPRPRWEKQISLAGELLQESRANPSALASRIEAWERRAVASLHLAVRTRPRSLRSAATSVAS